MSATNTEAPQTNRPRRRWWTPLVLLLLGTIGLILVWAWPAPDLARLMRILGTVIVGGLAIIGLLVWMFFFSGWSWQVRLALLVVLLASAGVFAAAVENVHFSGDMEPIFTFRWNSSADRPESEQATVAVPKITATDYPEYRNVQRDGIITGPPLAESWGDAKELEVWRHDCGEGHSSFAVVGNLAITQEQWEENEEINCYDARTGKRLWSYSYPAKFSETLGGVGPRATPTIAGGQVYCQGATGWLTCLDLANGQKRWAVNILEGNDNIKWAMSASPLVYDQYVVVVPGKQKDSPDLATVAAYNRDTGEKVWSSGTAPAGYSSPMLATLAGVRQVIVFDGKGIAGYEAEKGKELWRQPWATNEDINVAQPLVLDGDRVFVSSGYGVGCALLHITRDGEKWSVDEVWKNRNLRARFTNPIYYQGHIYGLDEGVLVCLDEKTGKRSWRGERFGHGQLLLTNGQLLIQAESGQLALVEATPAEFRQLAQIQALNDRTWNYPALAHGFAFVRNHREMACYDLRTRK